MKPHRVSVFADAVPVDGRGHRSRQTALYLSERDHFLREAARRFCVGMSDRQAAAISAVEIGWTTVCRPLPPTCCENYASDPPTCMRSFLYSNNSGSRAVAAYSIAGAARQGGASLWKSCFAEAVDIDLR
jgi:hypothetical protein